MSASILVCIDMVKLLRPRITWDADFKPLSLLGKRNTYAHPSTVIVVPHTAEEVILDLVNNIVLNSLDLRLSAEGLMYLLTAHCHL